MKNLLHNIFNAFISSQAWVAFCFALLCKYFQLITGWENDGLIYIAFFGTLITYNLSHWVGDRENWRLLIIGISCIFIFYFAYTQLYFIEFLILSILAIISIMYSWFFNLTNLRNRPKLKIFWISLVWASTIMLPVVDYSNIFKFNWLILFASLFLYVMGITIPFDIRDMDEDDSKMETLPQIYGESRARWIAVGSILISALCYLYYFNFSATPHVLAFLITLIIAVVFILNSTKSNNKWYTSFWLEGVSSLPFILYALLNYINITF